MFRGDLYEYIGEKEKALNDYNKSINLDPKEIRAYINRGNLYEKKKERDKALNDYMKAYSINNSDLKLLNILTNFYYLPILNTDYDIEKENIIKYNERSLYWANKLLEELEKQKEPIPKDQKIDFADYYHTVYKVYYLNLPLYMDIDHAYKTLKLIEKAKELNPGYKFYKEQYENIKEIYNDLKKL